jgi:hypothetical protein
MKLAAMVPYQHGTNSEIPLLDGRVGKKVYGDAVDKNPKGLYVASKRGKVMRDSIQGYAKDVVKRRGGHPTVAFGKMDTKKGWVPHAIKPRGEFADVGEAHDAVRDLDGIKGKTLAAKKARGALWEKLNRNVGAWHNPLTDQQKLRPAFYRVVGQRGRIKP